MEVITLDLCFNDVEEAIAAYVVVGQDGPVLIETGPGSTVPQMLSALNNHGISTNDIHHVFVTHINLDHAGAAGWWASQGARIYVHHRGAPHLIDPSRLLGSAKRVYGNKLDSLWGTMLPVPARQIYELRGDQVVSVNGFDIVAIDTPGHASHHHVLRIGDVAFCGDAGGARLPGAGFITVPTPPPEFNLDAWQVSIGMLLRERLSKIYLTHFGLVDDVQEHLEGLASRLNQTSDFVRERMRNGVGRDRIISEFVLWNREMAREVGVTEKQLGQSETANPGQISVDGVIRYWKKRLGED